MSTASALLNPELLDVDDTHAIYRDGHRLDQAEAAARFIAATEHEKMHDGAVVDLRQKRDREIHGITEWEGLHALASAIKEHTLTHLDQYLE
jgi:L-lactate dehydrogenase complex protein LldF